MGYQRFNRVYLHISILGAYVFWSVIVTNESLFPRIDSIARHPSVVIT